MIKSMTGFGRGENEDEHGRKFSVEIKTVNHRYTDFYVKLPRQISFFEEHVRNIVKKYVSRGKTEVFVNYEYTGLESSKVTVNENLANGIVNACRILKEKHMLTDDVTVSFIAQFPDVLQIEKGEDDEDKIWIVLEKTLLQALNNLNAMREAEGNGLRVDVHNQLNTILENMKIIDNKADCVQNDYRDKLSAKIKEVYTQQVIDENRLAMEVAFFADRCCINEEIVRIKSHIKQFNDTLDKDGAIGRRLDFLAQELHREANTIGSKSSDLEITNAILNVKSCIDKIKEQIQNIE